MGPRWKGKGSEAKALAEPMSKMVQQLQSSLMQSQTHGSLSGCSVLLEAEPEQARLLNMACFGRPIVTAEKDKQWFQLGFEEAFYLCHSLKCLQIVRVEDNCAKDEEVWKYMNSKRTEFSDFFKAYSHLRKKNWVVRPGTQYGVDFVAYRHHPAVVHSEYAVVVLSEGGDNANRRLRIWSDLEGTIRLCGSVAKTLLVLTIISSNGSDSVFPLCLEQYSVEERTCSRWSPEQSREDHLVIRNGASYGAPPNMQSMMGAPSTTSLPMQLNGLPRPPTMNPSTTVHGSTVAPTSNGALSMITPTVPTSGGFDCFNMNAASNLPRTAPGGTTAPSTVPNASPDGFTYSQEQLQMCYLIFS